MHNQICQDLVLTASLQAITQSQFLKGQPCADAPDLTKNPKDIGKDIVSGAKNLVGDLSLGGGLPNPRSAAQELKQGVRQPLNASIQSSAPCCGPVTLPSVL